MLRLVIVVALVASSGCLSASRSLEVRLRSTDDVEVAATRTSGPPLVLLEAGADAGQGAPIVVTRALVVGGKSLLVEDGTRPGGRTVIERVRGDAPAALPMRDGSYAWRRGVPASTDARAAGLAVRGNFVEVIASTPASNIERAEVVTQWSQPMGVLPSLASIVVGGFVAVGAGVAGGATLAESGSPSAPPDALATGLGLSAFALSGAALATYGVVTFMMVTGPPSRSDVPLR